MDLTERQWRLIAPLLPKPKVRRDGRGRPWRDPRDVMNGVLWIMRTGAPWSDLPPRYPPYQTCHRRFQLWVRAGTLRKILETLARDLAERGGIDLTEAFIDATFAGAKKGAPASEILVRARAPRSWRLQTALVFLSPLLSPVLRPPKSPSSSTR
jgi:transposase